MEQGPQPQHHREGIQNLMDKAFDEGKEINAEIDKKEAESREIKGTPEGGKETELNLEELKSRFAPFLSKMFSHTEEEAAETLQRYPLPSLIKPEDIDWEALKNDIDKTKFGEYSLNPETQGLDFESFPPEKIKVLDFKEFVGKPIIEMAKYLVENYADKYYIPGIEYWKYVIENPDKVASLKDADFLFLGSIFRTEDGDAAVPHVRRSHFWPDRFDGAMCPLYGDWGSHDRVVLLEK